MIAFFALHWNGAAPACVEGVMLRMQAEARAWRCLANRPGFMLWARDERAEALAGTAARDPGRAAGDTFIVGRAFRRDTPPSAMMLTGPISIDDGDNGQSWADTMCREWWGDYVVFSRRDGELTVLRDPVGALPCWHTDIPGARAWFSDVGDAQRVLNKRFTIDPAGLAAHVRVPKLGKSQTCLNEVTGILPAEVVVSAGDLTINRRFAWDPARFCDAPAGSVAAARDRIRTAVEAVLHAYAGYFAAPAISVGGLDSSIIWSLTAHERYDKFQGLTLFSESPLGDERGYVAQLPAQDRLHTLPMDGRTIDLDRVLNPRPMVNPPGFVDLIEMSWDRTGHPALSAADALIYGVGGDNVFLQGAGMLGAIDCAVSRRPIGETLSSVFDAARLSKRWWPGVLAAAIKARLSGHARQHPEAMLLSGTDEHWPYAFARLAPGDLANVLHPLLAPVMSGPPGKALQALTSCFCTSDYGDPYSGADPIERCEFFLSQPIVEACLQVPSWQLAHRGVERGLARLAFADVLPDPILRRMTKGTPAAVYDEFVGAHAPALRDFLVHGRLQARGLIDERRISALFTHDPTAEARFSAHTIVQIVGIEAWARHWT